MNSLRDVTEELPRFETAEQIHESRGQPEVEMRRLNGCRLIPILKVRAEQIRIPGISPQRGLARAEHQPAPRRIGARRWLVAIISKVCVREIHLLAQAMTSENFVELHEPAAVGDLARPIDGFFDTPQRRGKVSRY